MKRILCLAAVAAMCLSFSTSAAGQKAAPAADFGLKDGDTVVFYGDSITEQRQYTSDVEMFTLTRFPERKVRFLNAGVGGDKVSGGWAGPVDLRLERDVFAARPTVMTIMLGMNDGYYRPYDPGILSTYADGYRHILDEMKARLPETRVVLLKPSPFDDVTRAAQWDPGYNSVMLKFGDLMQQLAEERKLAAVDLNAPVTAMLARAKEADPVMAEALVLDRVHPGSAAHWIMAEAILKAWGAQSTVTSTSLDAAKGTVLEADNTTVTEFAVQREKGKKGQAVGWSWVQLDKALPLPLAPVGVDPYLALTLKSSDLMEALDQQPLRVMDLPEGSYRLLIDEQPVGTFTAAELGKGVNLAAMETPMLLQARMLMLDTDRKNQIENMHFSQQNDARSADARAITAKLAPALEEAFARMRRDAQPVARHFGLAPVTAGR